MAQTNINLPQDTNGERIARVETQIVDLKGDIAEVKSDTKEIKTMLGDKFMQRTEVKTMIEELKRDFANEQQRIVEEVKSLKKRRWYENTISAGMGVIITLVVSYAFQSLIK